MPRVEELVNWINERHAIYLRKAKRGGEAVPPWADPAGVTIGEFELPAVEGEGLTDDPVLAKYRFCNVHRELDRVTQWIDRHIRQPFSTHPLLWLMLAYARQVNWPPALEGMIRNGNWPSEPAFEPKWWTLAQNARARRGEKMETGAYMIRAENNPRKEWYNWPKHRYVAEIVCGRLWEDKVELTRAIEGARTLQSIWERLAGNSRYIGWGPFISYQFVLELLHTRYLDAASDADSWAALGPGSRRGLNRLYNRPTNAALSQDQGLEEMIEVLELVRPRVAAWVGLLAPDTIQNCLCEYDKWMRARLGEGSPRTLYVEGRGC